METLSMPKHSSVLRPTGFESVQKSILLIDDCADMLQLQKTVLEMNGFDVFTAQGGIEAMKILEEIDEPDLILLDMRMQDMSGADFLLLLEEKLPEIIKDVPIVFQSAVEEIPKSKATGFIRKTGQIEHFLEEVRRFISMGRLGYH
jgi:CheY-like chemotaxis protein